MVWLTSSYGKLPSQVEKTLAPCPRFRIVLVGKTGVGKSSLVCAVFNVVFNVDLPSSHGGAAIDIAHDRAGQADINHEFYSDQNPRFILHDSMGFEPGSTEKSEIVKSFLKKRAGNKTKLQDRVHAIWLCVETPREGYRLQQTGDKELLELAEKLDIPVIVVFTKYDLLIAEHARACNHIESPSEKVVEAKKLSEKSLQQIGKDLNVPFVAVSTLADKRLLKADKTRLLVQLTDVTRARLRDVGGSLWVAWATAQQVNAREKVNLSISEGSKKYWRNLGESAVFSGHSLGQCISRIHEDVLKVWNFNDPSKILYGQKFMTGMLELIEPLRDNEVIKNQPFLNERVGIMSNMVSIIGAFSNNLVIPALVAIMGTMAFNFLRSKYKKSVSTGRYLAAYIIDLILVLHELSITVMADPPKSLSKELIEDALASYKSGSALIHEKVAKITFTTDVEKSISSVILETLKLDK